MSGQCIAVVSGKGGTGKTSLTAGVGEALALMGHRVLCIDCDAGLRNLDLALGLTDRALMDFSDDAAVPHPEIPRLHLLTAPASLRRRSVTEGEMRSLLQSAREDYDYCLLDAPAGLGEYFRLATACADRCIVVTTTDPPALRDAPHTVMELDRFPRGRLHLVVNRVRGKLLRSMHATIDDAIDTAGLPLLGVVPEDDALPLAQSRGAALLLVSHTGASAAYRNIAKRITGQRVPLLRLR